MSDFLDLSLLAQEKITIKFDEDCTFVIPKEPTLDYSTKLLLARKKMQQAKTDDKKLDIVREVTTMILSQDESVQNVGKLVGKMSTDQIIAVFNLYENQAKENASNPN